MPVARITRGYDAIHQNVATKADLERIDPGLRAELRALEQRLEARFEALEQRLELRLEKLGRDINGRFSAMGREIDRVVMRVVAAVVIALTLLFGALHYWPPHS
jgi:hypothetical protein